MRFGYPSLRTLTRKVLRMIWTINARNVRRRDRLPLVSVSQPPHQTGSPLLRGFMTYIPAHITVVHSVKQFLAMNKKVVLAKVLFTVYFESVKLYSAVIILFTYV